MRIGKFAPNNLGLDFDSILDTQITDVVDYTDVLEPIKDYNHIDSGTGGSLDILIEDTGTGGKDILPDIPVVVEEKNNTGLIVAGAIVLLLLLNQK